jgi:Dihydrouridine synthase (Dus)
VGGNDASCLARAVQLVLQATPSFVGVNLNCECPSNKVATRREFGAALMLDVNKTASIVQAMHDAAQNMGEKEIQRIPVSVKTRIAVDSFEDWDFLQSYISSLVSAGGLHSRPQSLYQGIGVAFSCSHDLPVKHSNKCSPLFGLYKLGLPWAGRYIQEAIQVPYAISQL